MFFLRLVLVVSVPVGVSVAKVFAHESDSKHSAKRVENAVRSLNRAVSAHLQHRQFQTQLVRVGEEEEEANRQRPPRLPSVP